MQLTSGFIVDLIQALLANARALVSDGQLLHDNQRHARTYALAALAGEELGKVELCLDWLLGTTTLSDRQFRDAWRNHSDKLTSLTAYRAAFMDDPKSVRFGDLKNQPQQIGRKKMSAIYVDFADTGIFTPMDISAEEAGDLLERVDAAVQHATDILGLLTPEIAAAMNDVAPQILAPLDDHFDGLAPEDAIEQIRLLLARIPSITDNDWAKALEDDRISDLLGFGHGASD